jgi:hypothetical protein
VDRMRPVIVTRYLLFFEYKSGALLSSGFLGIWERAIGPVGPPPDSLTIFCNSWIFSPLAPPQCPGSRINAAPLCWALSKSLA